MKSKKKQKKQDTKTVKCVECKTEIVISKWAAKSQLCENCGSEPEEQEAPQLIPTKPANPALDKLIHAQNVLGSMGFIITSGGRYYKQYADEETVYKIEPVFDKGTSYDVGYTLTGIQVTQQQFVTLDDNAVSKMPKVAQIDIATLFRELNIQLNGDVEPTHIDTIRCSGCGKQTSDWYQNIKTGEFLCVDKCAPARRPIA